MICMPTQYTISTYSALSIVTVCLFLFCQKHPHLLVGYTPRTYFKRYNQYKYHYDMYHGKYTMMMTNVAFIHRRYLQLFTDTVPKEMIDFIIRSTNGEDITMNVVVGKFLTSIGRPQCVAMYVADRRGLQEIGNLSG